VPLAASGDFARFQSAEELDAFRERIGCPEGYVVAFATADSRENVELLCEAWGKVVQTGKIAESLLFAGGHNDAVRTRLLGRASILGIGDRVKFCGYVEELDLPTLYSASTCYVDCSRYEGFGLQSLEAMVAGTAVVASDIPATQEVVSDAALLYAEGSVDGLTNALFRVLTEPAYRSHLVERGRVRAREFSWHRTGSLTLGAYRELLSRSVTR
jgi:glycosyltransferase involved in cell wall biosynthesis